MPLQLIAFNPSKKRKTKKARASAKKKRKARRMTAAQKKYFAPATKHVAKQGGRTVAKKKKRRKGGWSKMKRSRRGKTQTAHSNTPPSGKRRRRWGGGGGGGSRKISIGQIGMKTLEGVGIGGVQLGLAKAQAWLFTKVWTPDQMPNGYIAAAAKVTLGVLVNVAASLTGNRAIRKAGDVFLSGTAAAATLNTWGQAMSDGLEGLGGLAFGPNTNAQGFVQGGMRLRA